MKTSETLKENVLAGLLILIIGGLIILVTAQNVRNTAKNDLKSNSVEVVQNNIEDYYITLDYDSIRIRDAQTNEVIFVGDWETKNPITDAIIKDNE